MPPAKSKTTKRSARRAPASDKFKPRRSRVRCKTEEGEFWTARQRQMHSMHYVVSYRASFKPELPAFFIERYSKPGNIIFDPFGGRGTTILQANLMGRPGIHNDTNPISIRIAAAKANPFLVEDVEARLAEWNLDRKVRMNKSLEELYVFYHPDTLRELVNLKACILRQPDELSHYIEILALSRLHGHSTGFFSVYTFPQISVPVKAQARINARRNQSPDYREVKSRIVKKARQIIKSGRLDELQAIGQKNVYTISDSRHITQVPDGAAHLIVTSPPFLDKVDYVQDNWLKSWFLGIDPAEMVGRVTQTRNLDEWIAFMRDSLVECARILRGGGRAVVEVGEVRYKNEMINLDEIVRELSRETGLVPEKVFIHKQSFTKLSNCFNVDNNEKGTNTNRCVVLRKAG